MEGSRGIRKAASPPATPAARSNAAAGVSPAPVTLPRLRLLFNPPELWDFTMQTSDCVEIKAHKAILAQHSRFLASMFRDLPGSDSLALPESLAQVVPLLQHAYAEAPLAVSQPSTAEAAGSPAGAAGSTSSSAGAHANDTFCVGAALAGSPSGAAGGPCPSYGLPQLPWGLWSPLVLPTSLVPTLQVARKFDCPSLLASCDVLMTSEYFKREVLRCLSPAPPVGPGSLSLCPPAVNLTPFACLALAHSYSLPAAGAFWRAEVLANTAALTAGWQQPACPARAAAEQQLADLPPAVLAELAAEALAQAGSQAVETEELRRQVQHGEKQRRKVQAFRRAVEEHVRDFAGAKDVRKAIKAEVHAVQ
ncbi:hypothetical protein ABPG75_013083 [Micractinium tetrahymenae]